MMTCNEKRKANNSGMTLVELLVAVVILAVIVTPLLHVFVSSARTNLNARRNMRNTTVVQDIMEGMKAESIETLAYGFNYPDGLVLHAGTPDEEVISDGFRLVDRALVDSGSTSGMFEVRASVAESVSAGVTTRTVSNLVAATSPLYNNGVVVDDGTRASIGNCDVDQYVFEPQADHRYYFAIRNMTIDRVTGGTTNQRVDALIAVDGSNYTSTGSAQKTSTAGGDEALLNDYALVAIQPTDVTMDAFYRQDENMAVNAAMVIATQKGLASNGISVSDIRQEITLTTKRIKPGESGYKGHDNKDQIEVFLTVMYTTGGGLPEDTYIPVKDQIIFSNRGTGEELRNLYVCYYPLYEGVTADRIYYKNEGKTDAVLHLVKQEPKDNTYLNLNEHNYKCDVYIEDVHVNADIFALRTNLDTNLYKVYMPGAMSAEHQARFFYNGITVLKTDLKMLSDLAGVEGAVPHKEERIFDVTIDVFEQGTLDALLAGGSITSSDDAFLFSVRGSMN